MFRHDAQHTGRSSFIGPQTSEVKWRLKLGSELISSPAIGKDGTIYMFDQTSGQLLSITDKSGNVQTLLYNTNNLLETVTDQATSRTLTFHYNTNNKIDHISGPVTTAVSDGVWVTYSYDNNNNLAKVQYADDGNGSLASGFEYIYADTNDPNNMTSKKDLEGHLLSTWTYNGND